jgi:hypothetical protein
MKKQVILKLIFVFLCILTVKPFIVAQNNTIISETWINQNPSGSIFRKVVVKSDTDGNVYVAGNILTLSAHDIILQKFDSKGNLLWERTYDGPGNGEDFSTALLIDDERSIYLTGSVTVSPSVGFSMVVLKFDSLGTLGWDYIYDNPSVYSPIGGGSSLLKDNDDLYVTGTSFGSTTSADFLTVKLNSGTGNEIWSGLVDNNGYRDIAFTIGDKDGKITPRGISEISPGTFMNGGASHDKVTGSNAGMYVFGDTVLGITDVFDVIFDSTGNMTIVGTTHSLLSGNDWLIIKFDAFQNETLRITETSVGNADDRALSVQYDHWGNIYVAGYFTVAGEGKNIGVAKYDNNGNRQWVRTYNGENSTDDSAIKLIVDEYGRVIISGYVHNNSFSDYVTMGFSSDGETLFQIEYDSPYGNDDIPTDMIVAKNAITVVGNCKNTVGNYVPYVVHYLLKERVVNLALNEDGEPLFNKNEIIIRFNPDVVNPSFVNGEKKFGNLSDIVPDSVLTRMSNKTGYAFASVKKNNHWASKIYIGLKTTDTISTSRGGQTIHLDPVWSSFVFHVEASDSALSAITDSLNVLPDIIKYAHRNYVAEYFSEPNDTYYLSGEQQGFKSNSNNPGGIGIEAAWDIQQGKNNVSIGVFDSEINWAHEDFGGPSYANSVVRGWDFCNYQSIQNVTTPGYYHGTSVGGIIGAIKNNGKGVAGIAGKDPSVSNSGVNLYSYKVFRNDINIAFVSDIAGGIHWGASHTPTYGAGLHIMNASWGIKMGQDIYVTNNNLLITINQNDIALLKDAVRNSFVNECVFVAARGNSGVATTYYPACYPDSWVLSVGASGDDGDYKVPANGTPETFGTSFGLGMDIIAPGITELVYSTTTSSPYDVICPNNVSGYACSAGSSVAAPHVSGGAALILSEQNTGFLHHPANLTGEDIEHLMEFTADHTKGTDFSGYDDESGWGLLRMDNLMPLIEAPQYLVIHKDGIEPDERQVTLANSNVTIFLAEQQGALLPGFYIADRYNASMTFYDDISPAIFINGWPLHARGAGLPNATQIYSDNVFNYSSFGIGSAVTSLVNHSFYLIKTAQGNSAPINQWIPNDTIKTRTPYSLWVYDESHYGTSIKEQESTSAMKVFPVPSSDLVTVSIAGTDMESIGLELISIDGKVVQKKTMALSNGKGMLQIDVKSLSRGIYFIKADFRNRIETQKIIVQ